MSEFKGTPGPWKQVENGGRMVGVMSKGEWVVYKAGQDRMSTHELEANAKLIAAAPDLLEALTDLLTRFNSSELTIETLENAKAAIAKATQ